MSKDDLLRQLTSARKRTTGRPPETVTGSTSSQVDYLLKTRYGGSTRRMAAGLGITQRHVQRLRKGERKGSKALQEKLSKETTLAWRADRPKREARLAKELRQAGDNAPSGVRVRVDAQAADLQIQSSPKIRGRMIMLDLTGNQAAQLARARTPKAVDSVTRSALTDYFNGVAPGRERTAFRQFGEEDINFDGSGVQFE